MQDRGELLNFWKGYKIIEEITTGGSERKFYRCVKNKKIIFC